MASTNKTDKLNLNQWLGTDKPTMADFNADNLSLENYIVNNLIVDVVVNSYGTAYKFANGLLIQYYKGTTTGQAINTAYGSLFLGFRDYPFPVAFINTNYFVTIGQCQHGTGICLQASPSGLTKTECQLNFLDVVSRNSGAEFQFSVLAVGKWK